MAEITLDKKKEFTFIDLFAGIGGMRLAFQRAGGRCVFSSEIDENAKKTYSENFNDEPSGDITGVHESNIPDHDVLLGGFPCQPFSLAGTSARKYHGGKNGFEDTTRGTLFFDIVRIIKEKKPKAFLLENVKNLKGHDEGRTYKVIMKILREELGYDVHDKVLDASSLVPQHRERIFIVGFKKPMQFDFPNLGNARPKLGEILQKQVREKYTLLDGTWKSLQRHAARHKAQDNGFGYSLADKEGRANTLSARYYKDGAEILIDQSDMNKNPRKLTPRECARLMGFPDGFKIPVSDNQAYKQFGNSVVVPVVEHIAEQIMTVIRENKTRKTLKDFS